MIKTLKCEFEKTKGRQWAISGIWKTANSSLAELAKSKLKPRL